MKHNNLILAAVALVLMGLASRAKAEEPAVTIDIGKGVNPGGDSGGWLSGIGKFLSLFDAPKPVVNAPETVADPGGSAGPPTLPVTLLGGGGSTPPAVYQPDPYIPPSYAPDPGGEVGPPIVPPIIAPVVVTGSSGLETLSPIGSTRADPTYTRDAQLNLPPTEPPFLPAWYPYMDDANWRARYGQDLYP